MSAQFIFSLTSLVVTFRQSSEEIDFSRFSYYFGKMGAGKSSILRLVDYCLGGSIYLTPALQSEFVSATLRLNINSSRITIERPRDSSNVLVTYEIGDDILDVILPARDAGGEIIAGTGIENLSDFIFFQAGVGIPKVRKGRRKRDTTLVRLSLRDLLWYCYLNQEEIDSNFYHLDLSGNDAKRFKSRDVLRYILGYHQEEVAQLEMDIYQLRTKKLQFQQAAQSLKEVLDSGDYSSITDINRKIKVNEGLIDIITNDITNMRNGRMAPPPAVEILRERGRKLSEEIGNFEESIRKLQSSIERDVRHINDIKSLDLKVKRVAEARAILNGVKYSTCPRCTQHLPQRDEHQCHVCGQHEPIEGYLNMNSEIIHQDILDRVSELESMIKRQKKEVDDSIRIRNSKVAQKNQVDSEISTLMNDYDSQLMSSIISFERRRAKLEQEVISLNNLAKLPKKVEELFDRADQASIEEQKITRILDDVRRKAEADKNNLRRLEFLFLDCLVRSRVPGFSPTDVININPKDFLPVVFEDGYEDFIETSFDTLGSGGKKTIFKVCYALAVHRLANEVGAFLPSILMIDSPMKNISERENIDEFTGFYDLLYSLAKSELKNTQIILVDKEFSEPRDIDGLNISVRHMTPDDTRFLPLIPYYRGH